MTLSPLSLTEVRCWKKNIHHTQPDIVLYSAARTSRGEQTAGIWSPSETTKHINVLGLLSIKLALSSLSPLITHDCHVRIMCDNTTAVTYINAMGGCKSLECNVLAQDIWKWAITRNIWLTAAHIPGVSNVNADALSRDMKSELEWMLSRSAFDKIVALFGQPDIYL